MRKVHSAHQKGDFSLHEFSIVIWLALYLLNTLLTQINKDLQEPRSTVGNYDYTYLHT